MWAKTAEVVEDVLVVAADVFERVVQHGKAERSNTQIPVVWQDGPPRPEIVLKHVRA
jgi:hypothetical protein